MPGEIKSLKIKYIMSTELGGSTNIFAIKISCHNRNLFGPFPKKALSIFR
jgi:hypothetical protein